MAKAILADVSYMRDRQRGGDAYVLAACATPHAFPSGAMCGSDSQRGGDAFVFVACANPNAFSSTHHYARAYTVTC